MRSLSVVLASTILSAAGCGSDGGSVMPDVTGKKLDVAKSMISDAGINADVEVDGGGAFGVVNDSSWSVCTQAPAQGAAVDGAPQLTVDRSCAVEKQESGSSSPSETVEEAPMPEATEPATPPVLTKSSSRELAAFLNGDNCDASVGAFVDRHVGETIRFNGTVIDVAPHGETKTRFDFLLAPGNQTAATASKGPSMKFDDVNAFDLNLSGAVIPEAVGVDDRFRFDAEVESFNLDQCLVFLKPIKTVTR